MRELLIGNDVYTTPRQNVCACVNLGTSGSIARINLLVSLAVCQLVVVNQQPQVKEKRTTITKKGM